MTDGMQDSQDGRKTRWDAHRTRRRLELVDAAIGAIAEEGPLVRVEQIAAHAGIARPLLYRHFTDRAALERAVVSRAEQLLLEEVNRAVPNDSVLDERVRAYVRAYFNWVASHQNLSRYCLQHASGVVLDNVRQTLARHLAEPLGILFMQAERSARPIDTLAFGLVGLIEATTVWWLANQQDMSEAEVTQWLSRRIYEVINGSLSDNGALPLSH